VVAARNDQLEQEQKIGICWLLLAAFVLIALCLLFAGWFTVHWSTAD
jgi:hypothetical protein